MKLLLHCGVTLNIPFGDPIRGLRITEYTMTIEDTNALLNMHEEDIVKYFILLNTCMKLPLL